MITKKELLFWVIIPVLSASISGIAVGIFSPNWTTKARENNWISLNEWQIKARQSGWIPQNECPAYPVKITLTSPGNNTVLSFSQHSGSAFLDSIFVVETSRPISKTMNLGFVIKLENDPNFYVDFPYITKKSTTIYSTSFRSDDKNTTFDLDLSGNTSMQVWAILSSNKNGYGNIYADVTSLESLEITLAVSESIHIQLVKKR